MGKGVTIATFETLTSLKVVRFLSPKEGFTLSSGYGWNWGPQSEEFWANQNSVGVLYMDPEAPPRRYMGGLIKLKSRQAFVGKIQWPLCWRSTSLDLSFEVRGRKYLQMAKNLGEQMALALDAKVSVTLECESVVYEHFSDDPGHGHH